MRMSNTWRVIATLIWVFIIIMSGCSDSLTHEFQSTDAYCHQLWKLAKTHTDSLVIGTSAQFGWHMDCYSIDKDYHRWVKEHFSKVK